MERYETVSEQPFIVINDYVLNIEDHVSEDELGLLIEDGLNDKVYSTMNPLNGDDEKSTKIVGTSKSIGEMLLDSNMAGSVYLYNNDTKYRYRISVNIDSKKGANSSVLNQEIKLLENNNKIWFERVDEPDKIQIYELSYDKKVKPKISILPWKW